MSICSLLLRWDTSDIPKSTVMRDLEMYIICCNVHFMLELLTPCDDVIQFGQVEFQV